MPEVTPSRYLVTATWDDVPHLDAGTKAEMLAAYSPHERDARSMGVPSLGSGAVYPIPLSDITEKPFEIPAHWPRAYALDVGWNRTAALWGAWSREDGSLHVYGEHYRGQAEPIIHAAAIKARGEWIPGVIDPASGGSSQIDGTRLADIYRAHGLHLTPADNSVEPGILDVFQGLSLGRIKLFSTLANTIDEYQGYHRNERGVIVKERDHLMDCLRYLTRSGFAVATVRQAATADRRKVGPADAHAGY